MPWWWREGSEQQQSIVAAAAVQQHQGSNVEVKKSAPITVIAKAFLVTKRRLSFHPDKKLFFLYEPGQQVSSAVKIKNTSRSPVAFKFQTNAPKSCFMRPPNGILSPGETIIAIVVKFVEQPERNPEKKSKDKFKIVSLKVKPGTEYTPELFDEQKEFVAVERVLQVVFLDPQSNSSVSSVLISSCVVNVQSD
eukprot:c26848_g1_i3 orf=739-1317(+)